MVLKQIFSENQVANAKEKIYSRYWWAKQWLGSKFSEKLTIEIADTSATFATPTAQEYHWVTDAEHQEGLVLSKAIEAVKDGDVFWDVGANIGLFTCFVGNAHDVGVVAIEPHPLNTKKLQKNIQLNSLEPRVEVIQRALGDSLGEIDLFINEEWDTMHSIENETQESITVEMITADELCDDFPNPDVVKIDVEGAEISVLEGMKATLLQTRCIICEIHHALGVEQDEVEDILNEAGFTIEKLQSKERTTTIIATKDIDA